jgi:hypothetical protein
MDIRRRQYAGLVEHTEEAVPVMDQLATLVAEQRREGRSGHDRPPSSRSDRSLTSAAGGRQLKTPKGTWSTTGVRGPAIPRTKR